MKMKMNAITVATNVMSTTWIFPAPIFISRIFALRVIFACTLSSLLLNPAQHLSSGLCGLRARDSVDADHQENLRIVRGYEYDGETVAGRMLRVGARRSACFRKRVEKRKSSMHLRGRSLLC